MAEIIIDLKENLPKVRAAHEAGDLQAQRTAPPSEGGKENWTTCRYLTIDVDGRKCHCAIGVMDPRLKEFLGSIEELLFNGNVRVSPYNLGIRDAVVQLQADHDIWAIHPSTDDAEENFLKALKRLERLVEES